MFVPNFENVNPCQESDHHMMLPHTSWFSPRTAYWYGISKSTKGKAVVNVTKAILKMVFLCEKQVGNTD